MADNMDDAAAALAGAPIVAKGAEPPAAAAAGKTKDGEGDPRGPRLFLPEDCPVKPLGMENGRFYYLDAVGQLRCLKAGEHSNKELLALFAPMTAFCHRNWPRFGRDGKSTNGWRPEECGEVLMTAAAKRGVWNPWDKVRSRGGWCDDAGNLILHCGDAIYINGGWQPPGVIEDIVYPTAPPAPRPSPFPASKDVAMSVLADLESFSWARGQVDPVLLVGFLGCCMLGGAPDWRPMVWITGDKGTGKSTLHTYMRGLLGGGYLASSDASEAGVRQLLGQQSLPVLIDEAEPEDEGRRMAALIKLARQASSGGEVLRGGADHQGQAFVARSAFMFSSILVPPLQGADRSRLAILSLLPLAAGAREPRQSRAELRGKGEQLRRRMVDGWERWPATLAAWVDALKAAGHTARGATQFGTLMAAAWLMLFDAMPTAEQLAAWAAILDPRTLAETAEDVSDAQQCLARLLTSQVMLGGGGIPRTVAQWVAQAEREMRQTDDMGETVAVAAKALAVIGLAVKDRGGDLVLAVAARHEGLARLFAGSHWQAKSGAAGVWSQSLGRTAGAIGNKTQRIGGLPMKATLVPLAAAFSGDEE